MTPLEQWRSGLATVAVHGTSLPREGGTSTAVHRSTAFDPSLDPALRGFVYSRTANPTVDAVAARVAALEGAEAATLLASGSAALVATLLAVVPPGGRIVSAREICGDAHRLLTRELPAMGRQVVSVSLADRAAWEQAGEGAAALFVEGLSNPMLRVADLPAIAAVARRTGACFVVDSTLATPVNQRALSHGANVVVQSATKALSGHSDLTAGVVAGSAELVAAVRRVADWLGACLDPAAASLLERGLKTLVLRIERQNATARLLAGWLEADPRVRLVAHPQLQSHPDQRLAGRLLGGSSGLVTFGVGSEERARRLVRSLRLIRPLATLGGVESVAATTGGGSHANLDREERRAAGIPTGTIRLSLGIEDPDDLARDLEGALAAVTTRRARQLAVR